ncbi:aminoacyl-tRNA deacylase [Thermostaphylospora chromogena]|uniref:Cys-tRNA(Pro) deacylase, prolyl-tRNA editing enzyme YbaK/EbsC n=1 Tax=Thermostaphylospora chromogena TaxID=35622 RepID=A0A1H1CHK1_9ACTN|nr:YbaK/EbsC family protein [Thermostaphylospora chromogena]SDQ63691.1 Cys-tRNA(Pro) deacylase, prolyl-tRNA editing enzyme YbaK/EbsC [Thermostaphylospora chromogena]
MKDALAIHRWLLAHQVHHEIVRLPRTLTSARNLPEVLRIDPADCLEVSVFEVDMRVSREPVAVLTAVATPPQAVIVASALGARRAHPASAFLVNAATEYAYGLVCPLLLPEERMLLIDERLHAGPTSRVVYTPTGERRTALSIRLTDLLAILPGKRLDLGSDLDIPPQPGPREVRRAGR